MAIQTLQLTHGHVLVVGDAILDRYWTGATGRISPEAPVPVVRIEQQLERAGGAGNVALNIVSLGTRARLVGVTGDDAAADSLGNVLSRSGVDCRFIRVQGSPTVTKLRVMSQHQQLLRLDFESGFPDLDSSQLVHEYQDLLNDARVVVMSDYAKGTLTSVPTLIDFARQLAIPVIVDPKGSDCARYRGASVVTPNLREFEQLVGKCVGEDDLIAKAGALVETYAWQALLITRGEQGMTLVQRHGEVTNLQAEAREVYDVTGAGDTVVAVLAACLANGMSLVKATALANTAAGIVVGKLGTATVTLAELNSARSGVKLSEFNVCNEIELLRMVSEARARGEKLVMTNGCFDILHAGHVDYLDKARRLGDRLIVAVNDDHSVRRLKGKGRPVNTVEHRMAVLGALKAVDWVVPFAGDTPADLIGRVAPDVLVKGGDYRPDDIAGADSVRAAGGEVVTIPLLPGCSTTQIIQSVQHPPAGFVDQ